MNNKLISHSTNAKSNDDVVEKIKARIIADGDKPHVTVKKQLEILDKLTQFDYGRFLLQHKGLNGYWTHYMLTHPWFGRKTGKNNRGESFNETEKFILDRSPIFIATQQRFEIFLKENQRHVKENATLACIPCGMLGELLYLNFDGVNNFKLVGVDYDKNAFDDAKALADKIKLLKHVEFTQSDAWHLNVDNQFDLISSNGLNIYEPDHEKVTALYQEFYNALKPGGTLVTSFLTYPPGLSDHCEWNMPQVNQDDLLMERIIFVDIIQSTFRCFRSIDQTKKQLETAGFKNIKFIPDKANIFPTVLADKS